MTQIINCSGNLGALKSQVQIYVLVNSSGVCPTDGVQILGGNFAQQKSQYAIILPVDSNGNSLS